MIINNKMYKRIEKKINLANLTIKPMAFIYLRLFIVVVLFVLLLLSNKFGYIIAPISAIVIYYLFEYICLDRTIIERMETLEKNALDFFPVFTSIYKNGKSIKNAIEGTTNIINNDLSNEFKKVLDDVELGKSLDESLLNMKRRIPSVMVNNIIVDLTESNRLGNNIDDSVNLQLDLINEKRKKDVITDLKIIPFRIAITFIVFLLVIMGIFFVIPLI